MNEYRTPSLRKYVGCISILAALVLSLPTTGLAQSNNPCDLTVRPVEGLFGYQLRDNPTRCEGFYLEKVDSGTPVFLAQLISQFHPYDINLEDPITVQWHSPDMTRDGRLEVISIPGRTENPFRMDADIDTTAFKWPIDFLSATEIGPDSVGFRAWTRLLIDGLDRVVHLPLRVFQGVEPDVSAAVEVGVFSRMTVRDAELVLAHIHGAGVVEIAPTQPGTIPAQSLIKFAIPDLSAGTYRADFSATAAFSREPLSLVFWIHQGAKD